MANFMRDHDLVRAYITAQDHLQYSQLPEDTVAIIMTHSNLPTKHLDLRFDLHATVADMKERFRLHIGTPVDHQKLMHLRGERNMGELSDNSRMLGYYRIESGDVIHIVDTDPYSLSRGGGLTDVSLVEKYRMSDETYEQRRGTVREFIRDQRKKDPTYKLPPKGGSNQGFVSMKKEDNNGPPPGPESVSGIEVGMRCEVMPGARRGVVRFVGEIESLKSGHWVGVQFDEPVGKSNGTVKGVKIFECPEHYGGFVRGDKVSVGDFPEIDLMDEDEGCECAEAAADNCGDEEEI